MCQRASRKYLYISLTVCLLCKVWRYSSNVVFLKRHSASQPPEGASETQFPDLQLAGCTKLGANKPQTLTMFKTCGHQKITSNCNPNLAHNEQIAPNDLQTSIFIICIIQCVDLFVCKLRTDVKKGCPPKTSHKQAYPHLFSISAEVYNFR